MEGMELRKWRQGLETGRMCTEYVSSGFLEDVEKNTCIFKDSCTIYVTNTLESLTRKCMQFVVRMNSHVLMAYVLSSAPPRMTDSLQKNGRLLYSD